MYGDSGKEWADSREERGDSGRGILERNGKGLRIVGKRGDIVTKKEVECLTSCYSHIIVNCWPLYTYIMPPLSITFPPMQCVLVSPEGNAVTVNKPESRRRQSQIGIDDFGELVRSDTNNTHNFFYDIVFSPK